MRLRDRIATSAGAATLATAIFAIGGAPRWTLVVMAVFTAIAAGSQITSRRRFTRPSPLLVLLIVVLVLTALQVIPLPSAVLATLNPTGHELVAEGRALAGSDASWMPLSLDPPGTRRALLEVAIYLGLAWVALRMAASEAGRVRLLAAVVVAIGVAAIVAVAHHLTGAEALYGMYTPSQATPNILAPLLNANHFACLLALGAALGAGLAADPRQGGRTRALWFVLCLICVAVALITRSRGGVMALAVAFTILGVLLALQRWRGIAERRRPDLLRVTVPAGVVVLCALTVVIYLSAGAVGRDLDETSLHELGDPRSKYAAWRSAVTLVEESPWLGIGRGAFEPAFTRVHAASAYNTFSHLENEYFQAVVDWGLVGAALIAVPLAWLVLVILRRRRDGPLAAGAIAGIAGVAAQSVFDFGLELPGLAVPVVIVLATLAYVPLREMGAAAPVLGVRAALPAALVVLGVWIGLPVGATLADDHDRLRQEGSPSLETAQTQMRRHPLDYVAAVYGARATRARPAQAMAFVNRALVLHPTHPGLHRLVAHLLLDAGRRGQAALEFQTALAVTRQPRSLITEIVAAFPDPAEAARAIPVEHSSLSGLVRALDELGRGDVAQHYLERVVEARPPDADAWRLLRDVARARNDLDTAERAGRRQVMLAPGLLSTTALARILVARGKLTDAQIALAGVPGLPGTSQEQIAARLLLCDVYIGRTDWSTARDCLQALRDTPALRVDTRREIHARLARVEEALGNARRAQWELQQSRQR